MSEPIKNLTISEIDSLVQSAGLPKFRAQQLLQWLYGRGAASYDEMTDLPKAMREQLAQAHPLYGAEVVEALRSADGSRKYLLRFHDGAVAETVALPSDDGRLTVCVSSQAGCAMGCAFCATGKQGLNRSLSAGEIVEQVLVVQRDFSSAYGATEAYASATSSDGSRSGTSSDGRIDKGGTRVSNVVVMGQGEPFANYGATLGALEILNHPKLLNIGARHMTISTCGLIGGIERLAEEPAQYTLAVSLHSAQQEVRDRLMPAVAQQRLGALRQAIQAYAEETGRRVSLEYALMKGVNDSPEALEALKKFCQRLLCHVNLIPLNAVEESEFTPVAREVMEEWRAALEGSGISVTIRRSRGADIAGACGQLSKTAQ